MCILANAIFDIELNRQFSPKNVCKARVFIFEHMASYTPYLVTIIASMILSSSLYVPDVMCVSFVYHTNMKLETMIDDEVLSYLIIRYR